MLEIDLHSILLTKPIVDAAMTMNPSFQPVGFKALPKSLFQGFPLSRINTIRNSNLYTLPPIHVRRFRGTKYYEIIDGRHRFAKALAEGREYIGAVDITDM